MQPGTSVAWRVLRGFMRATQPARCLPSFLVIGATQSGTTSFFSYLTGVPGVLPAVCKEIRFFSRHYERGTGWYRSFFPLAASRALARRRLGAEPAVGEASPAYLWHPWAPSRVHALDPGMRLIVLLRDPVDRAYAQYQKVRDSGAETLEFDEAIDAESERTAGELARMESDSSYLSESYRRYAYLGRSLYADQLEGWLGLFPREQLLVLATEDLALDPAGVIAESARFLGLPEPAPQPGAYPRRNTRAYDPLEPALRERLVRHFDEPNRRLVALIGQDLPWALSAARAG
jgi:sulfotransferase family protein